MGHIIKTGDKVLNLGSHVGLEALIIGKLVGPDGKLYILEPYSKSYQIMEKNIKLNKLEDRTSLYRYGASNEKGEGTISVIYRHTGNSRISTAEEAKKKAE